MSGEQLRVVDAMKDFRLCAEVFRCYEELKVMSSRL